MSVDRGRIRVHRPFDPTLGPARIFRAGSSSDLICAAIVAERLPPGQNVLAFSLDKSQAEQSGYRACFDALTALFDWNAVVDISGPSLIQHWTTDHSLTGRWRRLAALRESIAQLREWLGPALGLSVNDAGLARRLNERVAGVYLTCPHHSDVRALYRMFPASSKIYYPHSFDSLNPGELDHYRPFCVPVRRRPPQLALDMLKRCAFGIDAVPVRAAPLDMVYTFRDVPDWAPNHCLLRDALSRDLMARLFDRLPAEVHSYFRGLTARCRGNVGVLLVNPDDFGENHRHADEVAAYVHLANELARRGAETIVVKPHTRASQTWNARILSALRAEAAAGSIVEVDRFYEYPIEIVISPLQASACAGMGTTCLRTLRTIHGMIALCAEERMIRLFAGNKAWEENVRVWVEDYGKDYVAV